MSVGILDLAYGQTLKPGLTPVAIPISSSSFLNGITVNGNSFSFATAGDYQCQVSVDTDFGENFSRIVVELYNVTTGVVLDSFNIDGNSGDTTWPLVFNVANTAHEFQTRVVTFSNNGGTIKAVRRLITDLEPTGGGGGDDLPNQNFAVFRSAQVNLAAVAAGYDCILPFPIPVGSIFSVNEVGVQIDQLNGSITSQPTVQWGITGDTDLYKGPVQLIGTTAVGLRDTFNSLSSDNGIIAGVSPRIEIITPAVLNTATLFTGYFYFSGILLP